MSRFATATQRTPAILAWTAAAGVAFVVLTSSCTSVRIPESGSRQTVIFYAAPMDLGVGARVDPADLDQRLRRLGYREVPTPAAPGQFHRNRSDFEIWLRPFRDPEGEVAGDLVRIAIQDGRVGTAQTTNGAGRSPRLEPERIAAYEGKTAAVLDPLHIAEAPPLLPRAIVAIEDRRFYHHPGVDLVAMVRAAWVNLRKHETVQGASTLSQQLARSLFLHNQRSIDRKLREAVIALMLETRYSKEQILEAYMNAVYWGTWGAMEIRGARAASHYYLGKELDDADPADIALLVGLIQAPNAYSPYNSPEKARKRRDRVLEELGRQHILTAEEVRKAQSRPLPARRAPDPPADPAYFLDAARAEIERRAPSGVLQREGVSVYTTLDPRDQSAAVDAVNEQIVGLEREYRWLRKKKQKLQGAAIVIDPSSGAVRALVGGRDYQESPFNRAIDARRQPGSLFKPFVYLSAFLHSTREDGSFWTPATIVVDEPVQIPAGRHVYEPQNYDHEFRGEVTVRKALEQSLNVPTARIAQEVGIAHVAEAAHLLGIASPLQEVPSLALGSSEVTLMEMTEAYAGLANGGKPHPPTLLRGILVGEDPVPFAPLTDPPGVEAGPAYLVTSLLCGVIEEGTGARAHSLGVEGVAAGKTGTTDDYRDAWFIGFTPKRVTGVWVGFDRTDATNLSGAAAALPVWAAIMQRIEPPGGDGDFVNPPGVTTALIDAETGMVATESCSDVRAEVFLQGTEPHQPCERHEGFFSRLRRLFGGGGRNRPEPPIP